MPFLAPQCVYKYNLCSQNNEIYWIIDLIVVIETQEDVFFRKINVYPRFWFIHLGRASHKGCIFLQYQKRCFIVSGALSSG